MFLHEVEKYWNEIDIKTYSKIDRNYVNISVDLYNRGNLILCLNHFRNNKMISCEGNMREVLNTALWIRPLLSENVPIWMADGDFNAHVIINYGVEYVDVMNSWVDHSKHDPFEEYPEYFGSD